MQSKAPPLVRWRGAVSSPDFKWEAWPSADDIERLALAAEAGTIAPIQVARLCACARNAVRQRDEARAAAESEYWAGVEQSERAG